jgi:hypothetical protein
MTVEQILPLLANRRKGTIITLATRRSAKVRKGSPAFTKFSTYQVRIGHNYENQVSTKAARADGMEHRPAEDDYASRLNDHLSFNKENGRVYLSCQPLDTAVRTAHFTDAAFHVHTKEAIAHHLLASETRSSETRLHLRVPVETIVQLI